MWVAPVVCGWVTPTPYAKQRSPQPWTHTGTHRLSEMARLPDAAVTAAAMGVSPGIPATSVSWNVQCVIVTFALSMMTAPLVLQPDTSKFPRWIFEALHPVVRRNELHLAHCGGKKTHANAALICQVQAAEWCRAMCKLP